MGDDVTTQRHSICDLYSLTRSSLFALCALQVVDASDVILEVLDARDPEGCRCRAVEEMIQKKMDASGARNKRIILILNKIDLVPHENLLGWLKHFKREFDTIAFKSNTQQQRGNLKQITHVSKGGDASAATLGFSSAVGASQLLEHLKNQSRNLNIKTSLTVGIIGYPNVGLVPLHSAALRAIECTARKAETEVARELFAHLHPLSLCCVSLSANPP